jgi:hypothetical protein
MALIHQKYVVTDMLGDALYSALSSMGTKPDDSSQYILDPDFLPDPKEFTLSVEGHSDDILLPNPARAEVFKGLTFIFLDESQYNNLVFVINAGMGKAVEFNPMGKTVDDLVKFASGKGQVVLVARNLDEGEEDTLCREAAKR